MRATPGFDTAPLSTSTSLPAATVSASASGPSSQWVKFDEEPPVFQQPANSSGDASAAILKLAPSDPEAKVTDEELKPRPLSFTMPPGTWSPANPFVHRMNTSSGARFGEEETTFAQPRTEYGAAASTNEGTGTTANKNRSFEDLSKMDFHYSSQSGTGVFGDRERAHDQMGFDGRSATGGPASGVFGPGSQPAPRRGQRYPSYYPNQTGEWHYSLCGCFTRPGMSLQTFVIPCYTAATNGEDTGGNFWLHCAACLVPGVGQVVGAKVRGRVRSRYQINGSFGTDLLAHCLAPCCAMVQEKRQMKRFKLPRHYKPPPEWQLRQQQEIQEQQQQEVHVQQQTAQPESRHEPQRY